MPKDPAQALVDEILATFCRLTGALRPEGADDGEWTLRAYTQSFKAAELALAAWSELSGEPEE
ncbi:hypothetical protein GCM10017674_61030 [Streptomyces gardneri]|uniref:SAV-6107-like HEPN domain-containing protein n=1 Tax=Streptomyces gardneri TaxID=66892 RepID=A0A4Y3RHT6_9ACTN|nr:hypothetical protein SGA01_28200 [Streptomyces gardneri]GHH13555.1 hypothetical protein GCM10017674_61030 [Streptomyces gardneri]